jgi:hypothetical protein
MFFNDSAASAAIDARVLRACAAIAWPAEISASPTGADAAAVVVASAAAAHAK